MLTHFCLQHYYFEDEFNETGSGSGYLDMDDPCETEQLVTRNLQKTFLPLVYTLIFTLGFTSNGLVIMVLGCQRRLGSCVI